MVAFSEADRIRVTAPTQLAAGDNSLGLGADVDQHLLGIDAHDDAVDDVTVVELANALVLKVEVVVHGEDSLEVRGQGFRQDRGKDSKGELYSMTNPNSRARCRRHSTLPCAPAVRDSPRLACLRHAPWSGVALSLLLN